MQEAYQTSAMINCSLNLRSFCVENQIICLYWSPAIPSKYCNGERERWLNYLVEHYKMFYLDAYLEPEPDPRVHTLYYHTGPSLDPNTALFSVAFKIPKKKVFFCSKFFAQHLLQVCLHQVFKDNKTLRSHKTVETQVFLNFLAC